jgi:hypothetical protein
VLQHIHLHIRSWKGRTLGERTINSAGYFTYPSRSLLVVAGGAMVFLMMRGKSTKAAAKPA